jgi:tRNA threonylcarbamoyladenosine biosynthesis protein TsaE
MSATADSAIETGSHAETALVGRLLGQLARPGDVVALAGPLGAGKTCLAQGIARGVGVLEPVPSPTFNLLLEHAGELTLHHFDLYRLQRAAELEDIDFYATVESDGVSVIEWADRFPSELPDDRLEVVIDDEGGDRRRLSLEPHGSRARQLASELLEAWRHAVGGEAEPE